MVPITCITAGILGLLFLVHTIRVISARSVDGGPALGDGGSEAMLRKIRTHANFAEYIPFLLIILLLLELAKVSPLLLTLYSFLLITGRLIHAYGMLPVGGVLWARVVGMIMTMTLLGVGSLAVILLGIGVL